MIKKQDTEKCIMPRLFEEIIKKININTDLKSHYICNVLDKNDEEQIIYFILSIFWRGTLDWPNYISINFPKNINKEIMNLLLERTKNIENIKIYIDIPTIPFYSVSFPGKISEVIQEEILKIYIDEIIEKFSEEDTRKNEEQIKQMLELAKTIKTMGNTYIFNIQSCLFRLEFVENNKGKSINYGRNKCISEIFKFVEEYKYASANKAKNIIPIQNL